MYVSSSEYDLHKWLIALEWLSLDPNHRMPCHKTFSVRGGRFFAYIHFPHFRPMSCCDENCEHGSPAISYNASETDIPTKVGDQVAAIIQNAFILLNSRLLRVDYGCKRRIPQDSPSKATYNRLESNLGQFNRLIPTIPDCWSIYRRVYRHV